MKLLIASNNKNKVREIRQILGCHFSELYSLEDAGLDIDVVEDGESFAENAMKKATEVLNAAPDFDAVIADDSGLCVDALDGAPGVHSARFSGEGHDVAANNRKLMEVMASVPDEERGCRFVCCMALVQRDKEPICVQAFCPGKLLWEAHGTNGFGYDPYFFYEPFGKSFAELDSVTKNSVSHRRRALELVEAALAAENRP